MLVQGHHDQPEKAEMKYTGVRLMKGCVCGWGKMAHFVPLAPGLSLCASGSWPRKPGASERLWSCILYPDKGRVHQGLTGAKVHFGELLVKISALIVDDIFMRKKKWVYLKIYICNVNYSIKNSVVIDRLHCIFNITMVL